MKYIKIPKDLKRVKTKIVFGLTLRQIICFLLAGAVGFGVYFPMKEIARSTAASILLIAATIPFFVFALYEKNGQPIEKLIKSYIAFKFIRPQLRVYKQRKGDYNGRKNKCTGYNRLQSDVSRRSVPRKRKNLHQNGRVL